MQAPYKPVKVFDAKQVYDVWLNLVGDEELYDAMLEGKHAEVATRRGMNAEEILILDDFASQPGTRWHVDNLRFRCTTMVSRVLKWHLPATVALLTGGNENWLRDLTYEYMSDQRWKDLGHHRRFAECARFAKVVRQKLVKRRLTKEHLETVLSFELMVHELLLKAASLPADAWPSAGNKTGRPRAAPVSKVIDLPVNIVAWLNKPEGAPVVTSPEPTAALVWIPAAAEAQRMTALDADERTLFESCRGDKTVQELAGGSATKEATLQRWISEGALAV